MTFSTVRYTCSSKHAYHRNIRSRIRYRQHFRRALRQGLVQHNPRPGQSMVRRSKRQRQCRQSSPAHRRYLRSSLRRELQVLDRGCSSRPVHPLGSRARTQPEITKNDPLPANAETLEVVVPDIFREALLSNVLGSFMLIRALLTNLKASKEKPKCIVMTSGMGSIANNSGGAYAYGSSKAALNYVVKSFTHDVPEVMFASIHPGKVDTRMTHVREEGAIDPEEAVDLMLPIIDKLTPEQSGMYVDRNGKGIPW
nr:hypothetical protein B0A51_09695 [Rachicladosporium sp. CCFEE 5018]